MKCNDWYEKRRRWKKEWPSLNKQATTGLTCNAHLRWSRDRRWLTLLRKQLLNRTWSKASLVMADLLCAPPPPAQLLIILTLSTMTTSLFVHQWACNTIKFWPKHTLPRCHLHTRTLTSLMKAMRTTDSASANPTRVAQSEWLIDRIEWMRSKIKGCHKARAGKATLVLFMMVLKYRVQSRFHKEARLRIEAFHRGSSPVSTLINTIWITLGCRRRERKVIMFKAQREGMESQRVIMAVSQGLYKKTKWFLGSRSRPCLTQAKRWATLHLDSGNIIDRQRLKEVHRT